VHQLRLHADQDHDLKRPHCPIRAGRTEFGIHPGRIKVDIAAVVARKNEIVESFRSGVQDQIDGPNVRLYRGQGRFTGPHVVEVDGEAQISDKIFINTVRGHLFLPFLVSIK
jgi:pyruvate/2-oxoglutarate dehydrogenase complex dihydrolipoamide dehydrogenase (E3) component